MVNVLKFLSHLEMALYECLTRSEDKSEVMMAFVVSLRYPRVHSPRARKRGALVKS